MSMIFISLGVPDGSSAWDRDFNNDRSRHDLKIPAWNGNERRRAAGSREIRRVQPCPSLCRAIEAELLLCDIGNVPFHSGGLSEYRSNKCSISHLKRACLLPLFSRFR